MGTLTPDQNYDHLLIPVSGSNPMHDLQFAAKFKTGESFERGALISLDANGEYVAGLNTGIAMPIWAINATGDFDVNSDVGNTAATGVVGGFVATGGYELRTTEFDQAPTYTPNLQITNDTVTAGFVTLNVASPANDVAVVGVVSSGEQTENYDQVTLGFWPVYLPVITNT